MGSNNTNSGNNNTSNNNDIIMEENPETYDGIVNSIFVGVISLIGLAGTTIYLKKK